MPEIQPESNQQWSDDQVMDALRTGAAADEATDHGEQASAPVNQGAPAGEMQAPTEPTQPAAPVAPEQQNVETFDGGRFNPDELPEELRPAWHQLQADYTRKTQEIAEQRRQFEALGDAESLQQAVELHRRIADPNTWPQLYAELTEAMQQYGLMPANAPGTPEPQQAPELDTSEIDDPEMAALLQELRATQSRLDAVEGSVQQEKEAQMAEYQRQAFLGELQRQENVIRDTHKDWDDDKLQAVYEMSSFFGGNLLEAANRLDSLLQAERAAYLAQKTAVAEGTANFVPPAGAAQQTHQSTEVRSLDDLDQDEVEQFLLNRLSG